MSFQKESQKTLDPVRPGEQWFFYWKTSASLWEHKIHEFPSDEIIFIPLYWGFHAESNGVWDFGKFHPERDLGRLIQLLTRHNRKYCWLLPLTPSPFLPNGGVPISAARTLSVSAEGMHLACLDQENVLHKMYSFFEPKVFQHYGSFVQSFGQFLSEAGSQGALWGVEYSYRYKGQLISFLEDSSLAFEQGFSRYLKKNNPEGTDLTETRSEEKLKKSFSQEVNALFQTMAQEGLAPFWSGKKSTIVFGSGPLDTIERSLNEGKSQFHYFQELFESYLSGQWFSSALLTPKEKKQLLNLCLKEHFGNEELEYQFHYLAPNIGPSANFRPYSLIDVFENHSSTCWQKNGLLPFLEGHFRWLYNLNCHLTFTPEWIDGGHHRIKFFHAEGMDRTRFGQMLKLFLMGQKVVLDRSGLSEDLDKRLQIFFLENDLKLQSVNYLTSISLCELGEGRFITFEGERLEKNQEREKFWEHLFQFLNLNHPKILSDGNLFTLWRIRETSPHELNYLDVRRVNLYNPTSYKKSVVVHTHKKFAFMKMIDPLHASAQTTSEGVEVELLPNGKIALDFGHYEEN